MKYMCTHLDSRAHIW